MFKNRKKPLSFLAVDTTLKVNPLNKSLFWGIGGLLLFLVSCSLNENKFYDRKGALIAQEIHRELGHVDFEKESCFKESSHHINPLSDIPRA